MPSVAKWGVELEGGWDTIPCALGVPIHMRGDGSVHVSATYVGECSCEPQADWGTMLKWMLEAYPNHTNESCGLHVHASVATPGLYSRLMDIRFAAHVRRALRRWGESVTESGAKAKAEMLLFWSRLRGENSYCRKMFLPDDQCSGYGDSRYGFLNFCYGKHKTFELRVLPCFSVKSLAEGAVTAYCKAVEAWVGNLPERSRPSDGICVVLNPGEPLSPGGRSISFGDRVSYSGHSYWVVKMRREGPKKERQLLGVDSDGNHIWIGIRSCVRMEDERPTEAALDVYGRLDLGPAIAERYGVAARASILRVGTIYAIPSLALERAGYNEVTEDVLAIVRDADSGLAVCLMPDGDTHEIAIPEDSRVATQDDVTPSVWTQVLAGSWRHLDAEWRTSLQNLMSGGAHEEE